MRRAELLRRRRKQYWRQLHAKLAVLLAAARGMPSSDDASISPCIDDGEHDWIWEGQTMDGNVWSCKRCKALRFA